MTMLNFIFICFGIIDISIYVILYNLFDQILQCMIGEKKSILKNEIINDKI